MNAVNRFITAYEGTQKDIRAVRSFSGMDDHSKAIALMSEFAGYNDECLDVYRGRQNEVIRRAHDAHSQLDRNVRTYLGTLARHARQLMRGYLSAPDDEVREQKQAEFLELMSTYHAFTVQMPAVFKRANSATYAFGVEYRMLAERLNVAERIKLIDIDDVNPNMVEGKKAEVGALYDAIRRETGNVKKEFSLFSWGAYRWKFIRPSEEKFLDAFEQAARQTVRKLEDQILMYESNFSFYQQAHREMDGLTKRLDLAAAQLSTATPNLEREYLQLLASPAVRAEESKKYDALKKAPWKKVRDAKTSLDEAVSAYNAQVQHGTRAVDSMTRKEIAELKKMEFVAAYDEKTRGRYRKALEDTEQLQEKRNLLGLKTLDELDGLKRTLGRNVDEIERHLDYQRKMEDLKKEEAAKLAEIEEAKQRVLAAKDAELAARAATIKSAEASVAAREAELAGLNAKIEQVEERRVREEAQRLDADAALRQKEGELAAERRLREKKDGELARTNGELSTTRETLRQQEAAREEESARRRDAEQQVRIAEQQAAEAREAARLAENEARRVAEEAQRTAAEAEAAAAAERAAQKEADEKHRFVDIPQTSISPRRAIIRDTGSF